MVAITGITILAPGHYCWVTATQLTHGPLGDMEIIFKNVIFKPIFQVDILNNSYKIALTRMPRNPFKDRLTLVQVIA